MRIACIYVPQFALQCATRLDSSLRGKAAVVVGIPAPEIAATHRVPVVTGCARAAWGLGVRLGMTASAARVRAPAIEMVSADFALERETAYAMADVLLGLTNTVDLAGRAGASGAHLAMYAAVPPSVRGATFGNRIVEQLKMAGLTCRVGIADDRFTARVAAWVAASHSRASDLCGDRQAVVAVPRGGAAAFLAPLPLSLLQIPHEVQHMLEALSVRTLGEFAALPEPSAAVRWMPLEADYQALARGEGSTTLHAHAPRTAICEEMVVEAGDVVDAREPWRTPAAIAQIARRVAMRLTGRGCGATQLQLSAQAESGAREIRVAVGQPLCTPEQLARTIAAFWADNSAGARRLQVKIVGSVDLASTQAHSARVSAGCKAGVQRPSSERIAAQGHLQLAEALPQTDSAIGLGAVAVPPVDPLALVLSTSGALFSLSTPLRSRFRRSRMRRGKSRHYAQAPQAQSRLF